MSSPVGPSEAVQIAIDLLVLLVYGRNVVDFDSDSDSDVVASRVVVEPVGVPVQSQPRRMGVRATQASRRDADGVNHRSIAPPRQAIAMGATVGIYECRRPQLHATTVQLPLQ